MRDRAQLKDCEFGRDVIIDFDCRLPLLLLPLKVCRVLIEAIVQLN